MRKHIVSQLIFAGILASSLLLVSAQTSSASAAPSGKIEKAESYASDAAITAKVKEKFFAEKDLSSLNIKVETAHGVVTLQGHVAKKAQADLAEKITRETKDVRGVENKITVAP
jgi:hyperosmotically inducible protein